MEWFRGKKVCVTGGSSGIGQAAAMMLAKAGAEVALVARGAERLEAVQRAMLEVQPEGRFPIFALDVSDRAQVQAVAPTILAALGGLDVLINNAGVTHPGFIQDIEDAVFDQMMAINYMGTVHMTRAMLPHFIGQKAGHICNVSSMLGFMGIYGYTAYAASKFAITGFSECLRQEMLPHQVRVSLVFPPDTDTPQLAAENQIKPAETKAIAGNVKVLSPEAVAQEMLQGIRRGRFWILPGFGSKFTHFMMRHFPTTVRWFIDGDLMRYRRRAASVPDAGRQG